MINLNGVETMKDVVIAFITMVFLAYVITGCVWLVQFYGWSKWTLVLPILLIMNFRVRIKSDEPGEKTESPSDLAYMKQKGLL